MFQEVGGEELQGTTNRSSKTQTTANKGEQLMMLADNRQHVSG